jgi:hypothetical protein
MVDVPPNRSPASAVVVDRASASLVGVAASPLLLRSGEELSVLWCSWRSGPKAVGGADNFCVWSRVFVRRWDDPGLFSPRRRESTTTVLRVDERGATRGAGVNRSEIEFRVDDDWGVRGLWIACPGSDAVIVALSEGENARPSSRRCGLLSSPVGADGKRRRMVV